MRELKFRAWDKKVLQMYSNVQNHINDKEFAFGCMLNNGRFAIMQYTGLKDKNGKEIYEGDIINKVVAQLSSGNQYKKGDVIYSDGAFRIRMQTRIEPLSHVYNQFYEVIGNIYENHVLLS